ncbi:unnamed protein product [Arctia plantaginis]|uniref:Uncharacterized protein n=1 Tax=Arctia plantaginis TaxID=874455 RepID=A0A8S0YUT7_ARCPL|nr:unnamed protein product [Arctia plantaginis]
MWMRILCLVLIVSVVSGGQFLSHLYGKNGHNYMLICLKATEGRRARACPGALLNYDMVGVSAGCLQQHPQKRMVALRPIYGERCEDVTNGNSKVQTRDVWDHFYHPWMDFALVVLDRPYDNLDAYPNNTAWTVPRAFRKHGQWKWMKVSMKISTSERARHHHYMKLRRTMISMRAPFFITIVAIVIPILIFVLVSFVVFYATSSKAPSKSLQYNKAKV